MDCSCVLVACLYVIVVIAMMATPGPDTLLAVRNADQLLQWSASTLEAGPFDNAASCGQLNSWSWNALVSDLGVILWSVRAARACCS